MDINSAAAERIVLGSFAKINLSLDVKGLNAGGYHDVDMVMQLLSFHDDVEVEFLPGEEYAEEAVSQPYADAGGNSPGSRPAAAVGVTGRGMEPGPEQEPAPCSHRAGTEPGAVTKTGGNSPGSQSAAETGSVPGAVPVHAVSAPASGVAVQVSTSAYFLPTDDRNIACRAAELMAERFGHGHEGLVRIFIKKRIPVGAGLAGGSGNAAAVIHALNVLWQIDLSLEEIMAIGAEIGSDVPFCACGQARLRHGPARIVLPLKVRGSEYAVTCARATGRGTEIFPCGGLRNPVVFAKPGISVSTKEVYRGIDSCVIPARPDNDRLVRGLNSGSGYRELSRDYINVLENYTLARYKRAAELKQIMSDMAPAATLMTGSGPTVFSLFENMDEAMQASAELRGLGYEAYWTKCV